MDIAALGWAWLATAEVDPEAEVEAVEEVMAVPDDDNVEIGAGVSEADAGDFRFWNRTQFQSFYEKEIIWSFIFIFFKKLIRD